MMSHLPAAALALALLSVLASVARGQTINSPASLEVCAPQQILVNGGTPPYSIAALPGGATGGQVLSRISTDAQQGSVTWTVDVPAGQNVTLAVRDSTGATGYSSQIPVLAGVSDACLATDAAVSADATSRPESSAAPSSLSSSASFDEASVSSLIDSLTRFTPPGGVEPTMLPSMTSHSETTGRVTPMDTPLLPTSRTTLAVTPADASTAPEPDQSVLPNGGQTSQSGAPGSTTLLFPALPLYLALLAGSIVVARLG